jgi:hypothetical protein
MVGSETTQLESLLFLSPVRYAWVRNACGKFILTESALLGADRGVGRIGHAFAGHG